MSMVDFVDWLDCKQRDGVVFCLSCCSLLYCALIYVQCTPVCLFEKPY